MTPNDRAAPAERLIGGALALLGWLTSAALLAGCYLLYFYIVFWPAGL